jgi:PAS domain S-box-containing protein
MHELTDQFKTVFNLSPFPMILYTLADGLVLEVNDRYLQTFGLSRHNVVDRLVWESEVGACLQAHFKLIGTLCQPHRLYNAEVKCSSRGEEKTLLISADAIRFEGQLCVLTAAHDITVRKQAEKLLQEKENLYRLIAENSTDIISRHTLTGDYLYVSPACRSLLGYEPEDLAGHSLYDFIHPDDVPSISHLHSNLLELDGIFTHSYRILNKHGEYVWVESTIKGVRDPRNGQLLEIIGAARDISIRKQTEQALRKSEERYRSLFEHNLSGVFLSSLDGIILDCNQAFAKILGYDSCDEIIGFSAKPFYTSAEDRSHFIFRLQVEGALNNIELPLRRKDGSVIWILENVRLVGEDASMIEGIMMDITSHKEGEAQLRQSREQLRMLSAHLQTAREQERINVAREIHDELGQALTTLKFNVAGLREKVLCSAEATQEHIQKMSDDVDAMIQTVRRIATDLRPAVLDNLGIAAAIEWLTQEFQRQTDIKCNLIISTNKLVLDPARSTTVFRILQEALTNVARHAHATNIEITIERHNGHLVMQVEDNGVGITPEQASKPQSLGIIGMQERSLLLGGEVIVRRARHKGTRVIMKLPLSNSTFLEETYDQDTYCR